MYHVIVPEVAGGLGSGTILDVSVFPPIVTTLDYQFEGWSGDDILETFPCFIVTDKLQRAISQENLSGCMFSTLLVTKSSNFIALFPNLDLLEFYWMKVNGKEYSDDFFISDMFNLVASDKALNVLSKFNLLNASINDYR